jgi:hypothetical protein
LFTKDTLIKPPAGDAATIGDLAASKLGTSNMVAAKARTPSRILRPMETAVDEFVELVSISGRRVKCSLKAKLCLSSGGYAYPLQCDGQMVDTESGPERITEVNRAGAPEELISIAVDLVHLVNANGFWFLTE